MDGLTSIGKELRDLSHDNMEELEFLKGKYAEVESRASELDLEMQEAGDLTDVASVSTGYI